MGNTTKNKDTQSFKELLESITVGYGTPDDNKNLTKISFFEVIGKMSKNRYAPDMIKYNSAKSNAKEGVKVSKDNFMPYFIPHANMSGSRKLLDDSGERDHSRWEPSKLIHGDLDNIPADEFKRVWELLLETQPLAMFASPNKGIKVFYYTDIVTNNEDIKKIFTNVCRFKILEILRSKGLEEYYDFMPTHCSVKCYVSGSVDGSFTDIFVNQNYKIVTLLNAIKAVRENSLRVLDINEKRAKYVELAKSEKSYDEWNDLHPNYQKACLASCEQSYREAVAESTSTGNGSSFTLAGKLASSKITKLMAREYMVRFSNHHKRINIKIDKQLDAGWGRTEILGGKVKETSKYTPALEVLNRELEKSTLSLFKITRKSSDFNKKLKKKKPKKVNEVKNNLDTGIKTTDLSKLNVSVIKGLPGSGKSFRRCRIATDTLFKGEITLYICPDIHSITKNVSGSRYDEIEKYLKQLHKMNNLDQVFTIHSQTDMDSNQRQHVGTLFENSVAELKSKSLGGVIFLTMAGLKVVDLELLKGLNTHIVFDDINELSEVQSLGKWNASEVKVFSDNIVFDAVGCSYRVKHLSHIGVNNLLMWDLAKQAAPVYSKYIRAIDDNKKVNMTVYYIIEKDELVANYKVGQVSIFNLEKLKHFKSVVFSGDQVEHSPMVKMISDKGNAEIKEIPLPARQKNLAKRCPIIYYITDYNYSKGKVATKQNIVAATCKAIGEKFGNKHENALLCLNNDQKSFKVFESEMGKYFDNLTINGANTKGKNDLQDNTIILSIFRVGLNATTKHLQEHLTGYSKDDLEIFVHQNLLMQNALRGNLRREDDNRNNVIVVPTKADATFLQSRFLSEANEQMKIELIDSELSEMFAPLKTGRNTKSETGIPMTARQRNALSRLRGKFKKNVDLFEPLFLLKKTYKLRGKELQEMFDGLLADLNNTDGNTKTENDTNILRSINKVSPVIELFRDTKPDSTPLYTKRIAKIKGDLMDNIIDFSQVNLVETRPLIVDEKVEGLDTDNVVMLKKIRLNQNKEHDYSKFYFG